MVRRAEELAAQHDWFLARQFQNPANPAYHASTTGPEILRDFAGDRLDYWVTGWGTGGTLSGAGRTLKAARPDLKIMRQNQNKLRCCQAAIGLRIKFKVGRLTLFPMCWIAMCPTRSCP
ncbi:MAG: hypothetical protein CM15mP68_6130 [Pseudomonadota bacterium]|nr:MAG: hypothetical protein CM15mP68_6130 [Pseudomonadota bacterium]